MRYVFPHILQRKNLCRLRILSKEGEAAEMTVLDALQDTTHYWLLFCRETGFIGKSRRQAIPYKVYCPAHGWQLCYPTPKHTILNNHTPPTPHFVVSSKSRVLHKLVEKLGLNYRDIYDHCENCKKRPTCKEAKNRIFHTNGQVCWLFQPKDEAT